MSETMCQNEVDWERAWPGRDPDYICDEHRVDTEAVAEALEIKIPIRAVFGDEASDRISSRGVNAAQRLATNGCRAKTPNCCGSVTSDRTRFQLKTVGSGGQGGSPCA